MLACDFRDETKRKKKLQECQSLLNDEPNFRCGLMGGWLVGGDEDVDRTQLPRLGYERDALEFRLLVCVQSRRSVGRWSVV